MEITQSKYLIFDKPHVVDVKRVIKIILYPFVSMFYKILYLFFKEDMRELKYIITICAIFKNEAPYLREWIEYHLMLGVNHFYLYNNNSTDNFEEILAPYIEKGQVTLTFWPEYPGQVKAYKHWYDTYRNESNWVAFIDIDEYICPRYDKDIPSWLKKYSKYPILVAYWQFFGTSGNINIDKDKLLIEQLTSCYEKPINMGKVFYNTRFEIPEFTKGMMHLFNAKKGCLYLLPINDQRNIIAWDIHLLRKKPMTMQLNHYWSRTYGAYCSKKDRGGGMSGKWITDDIFWRNEFSNISKDYCIYRFILKLRLKLNMIEKYEERH